MITKKPPLNLVKISRKDLRFLYSLLRDRDPKENISHQKMPTFNEHVKFVLSKPYFKWYVIKYGSKKIGSCYITTLNEIGINITNKMKKKSFENQILQLIMKKHPNFRYLVNISPQNKKTIQFFKDHGFNLIQYTYEFNRKN